MNIQSSTALSIQKKQNRSNFFNNYKYLYLMLAPAILSVAFFSYLPLPGLMIAFMDYDFVTKFNSPWVGFDNIIQILTAPMFGKAVLNTLKVSLLSLFIGFPIPIIFALLLNEMKAGVFKRSVQTISYLPHFLSWISVIGIVFTFLAKDGVVNDILVTWFGMKRELLLSKQGVFLPLVITLDCWKGMGWNSIIYLAALTSIDEQLYAAAAIDGAGRFRQLIHITLPGIMPTAIMLLILRMGTVFSSNFELIYGLQNPFIDFEVISTVVYKYGITQGNFSVATAFGFMEGIVSLVLVVITNYVSKKVTQTSIW